MLLLINKYYQVVSYKVNDKESYFFMTIVVKTNLSKSEVFNDLHFAFKEVKSSS